MGKRPVSTLWQPRSRPASEISYMGLAPWFNRLFSDVIMTGEILQYIINDMYNGAGLIMQSQGPTPIFLASSTSASECRGRFRWLGGEVASRGGGEGRGFDQWSTRHSRSNPTQGISLIFIGPESDHWECLSVTHSLTDWLTDSCLVNLVDETLVCEDASILVEVVTVDAEKRVDNSLVQIWKLKFGVKISFS